MANTMVSVNETKLKDFSHQVAGHGGILHTEGDKILIKPMVERELKFYEQAANNPLIKPFLPEFFGTLQLSQGFSEKAEQSASFPINPHDKETRAEDTYICLENLVCHFENACIADIKLGTQLYDLDATPEKRARMEAKAMMRTTNLIGTSISGLSIPGKPAFDRKELSKLTLETMKTEALIPFFAVAEIAVSAEYRKFIIRQFITELEEYREVIRQCETRMFSSSVLLVYDASKGRYARFLEGGKGVYCAGTQRSDSGSNSEDGREDVEDSGALLDMRAIDFAHGHWVPGQGPDEKYLFGLDNFIRILREILAL
ncbi:hypothetical protein LPJ66_009171 [Kickxella alabastrina]|uniref:Uncharacterized protein n=1 Tax=Kickxella alabastrina TaxID=61397 RepID=A0ACC1IC35_9FUNG|nr:hypothetical protein LPJ66_009171 [Kickxella alabastrina]